MSLASDQAPAPLTTSFVNSVSSAFGRGLSHADKELKYLSRPAPNIVEWVTGRDYWGVPQTFEFSGQYQFLRDAFNLRCPLCNSNEPDAVTCWGKSRQYLESENLLVWQHEHQDFCCPSCGNTLTEFFEDGLTRPYNDLILIVGMRAGKSYTGAHIGGYVEHIAIANGIEAPGNLQRMFGVEKSEWFEVTFAASTATQAQDTIYAKYREMRRASPWIQRYVTWVGEKEAQQIGVKEPWKYNPTTTTISDGYLRIRYNRIASDSAGVAGKTRLFASIDEWARLQNTESGRSAQELFRVLNNSLQTVRAHIMQNGMRQYPFGLMVNVTSPLALDDPAMTHFRQFEMGGLKSTYGRHCPTWDFNPKMPRETFDEEYEKDPVGAERDFGANPPNAAMPLVDDPIRFWSSIDFEREPIAQFSEVHRADKTGKQYLSIALDHVDFLPRVPHFIFGDAGVSWDAFSLVCAHPEWRSGELLDDVDGVAYVEAPGDSSGRKQPANVPRPGSNIIERYGVAPDSPMAMQNFGHRPKSVASQEHPGEVLVTVIDFVVRIVPTFERDIWFQGVVDLVRLLKDRVNLGLVCFDRWSSDNTMQQIRDLGIMSHSVSLKAEDFVTFTRMTYNGRVALLPPTPDDMLSIDERGGLILGKSQALMSPQGVGLVELMKLQRSPDLRKVYNPNKGKVRGVDSDDTAHSIVGAHKIVQDSVVDRRQDTLKRREQAKKQVTQVGMFKGRVVRGGRRG